MPLLDSLSHLLESSDDLDTISKINVLVCTANIGNEAPNLESMSEWIPKDGNTKSVVQNQQYPVRANGKKKSASDVVRDSTNGDYDKFHIIAIGMQEATFDLSSSEDKPTKSLTDWSSNVEKEKNNNHDHHNGQGDTQFLHQMLSTLLPTYTRAVSYQRGQMRLIVFYKKDQISLNVLSVKAQNTGKGGRDNKGGIVAECDIDSGTRISFLTAHLEAHEGLEKYNTRCSTLLDIFGGTTSELANSCCDVSLTSHFTFAMGDLNFRTRLPNHKIGSKEHIEAAQSLAERQDWDTLNEHDELMRALRNKECLVGFCTPRCDFPPTFKIERKDGYVYKSNRSPSYTDRILYKANHDLSERIDLKAYGPIDHFTTSDHKPVIGAYEIKLNQRLKFRSPPTTENDTCFGVIPVSTLWRNIAELVAKPKASPETLHFSISSIGCVISQGALSNSTYTPSLFASFLTTPKDAIEATEDASVCWENLWQRDKAMVSRTEVISNTFHPQWEREIRFMIRQYSKSGTPVDLTGSMLHVIICDVKDDNSEPLGSYSLNLASLIIDSMYKNETARKSVSIEHSQEAEIGKNTEGILMKDGKEVGMIKLNIDTLWLSQ